MTARVRELRSHRRWKFGTAAAVVTALVALAAFGISGAAIATTTACSNAATLGGSAFEIDTDANLKVDTTGCIDWLASGQNVFRTGVAAKNDKPTGASDDSFGQGTSEDDPNPTIVDGSIPPNKSDLKAFGVYGEVGQATTSNPTGKFLALFWSRVQNPSGTTNMDFELNQKFCDLTATTTNCADNGKSFPAETPIRTPGDKLITYDLSKGGTVPTISIRTWSGSAWGTANVISGTAVPSARGSVNASTIPASETGGATGGLTASLGSQDPFTFGEASIAFSALFSGGTTCGTFGSAYLKSRSSDSFTAEIKDFVGPERVNITNCVTISTTLSASTATVGDSVHDSASLSGATANAGGTVTYTVYSDNACTQGARSAGVKTVTNGSVPDSNSLAFNSAGTFYWQAVYSGDPNNTSATSPCTSEQLVVNKASPTIATTLSATAINVGDSAHDSATLSNATSNAGGTATYTVYSDSGCSQNARAAGTVNVTNGVVPDSNSLAFNSAGTFYWQVSYSGDGNNNSATSTCTSEQIVVSKVTPTIATTLSSSSITVGDSAHDSATLSGATSDAGGSVTYTFYSDSGCSQNPRDAGTKSVTNGVVTDSDSLAFNSVGTFYWQAVYTGDGKNNGATSTCTSEQLVVGKASSSIGTAQRLFPQDSATVSATAGGTPGGSVTFKLFGPDNATCDPSGAAAKYSETVSLSSGAASTNNQSFSIASASASTYRWLVVYSGDGSHDGSTSACGTEQFSLTIANN